MKTNDFFAVLAIMYPFIVLFKLYTNNLIKINIVHQFCIIINCANTYEYRLTEAIIQLL